MDPYVKVKTSKSELLRTKTQENAGKTPVWEEVCELDLWEVEDTIEFEVKDEGKAINTTIGSVKLDLVKIIKKNVYDDWLEIFYNNKSAGTLRIKTEWKPYPASFK